MRLPFVFLALLLPSVAYADISHDDTINTPPTEEAPPTKACHTLQQLKDKLKDKYEIDSPLIIYGIPAIKATDYLNNKVGERTYYKADTLVVIPNLEKKMVVVWFVLADCVDDEPIEVSIPAFLAAVGHPIGPSEASPSKPDTFVE